MAQGGMTVAPGTAPLRRRHGHVPGPGPSLFEAAGRVIGQESRSAGSALARYIAVVAWGLAVEAQSGTKRKDLYSAITAALASWPAATVPTSEHRPLPPVRESASTRRRR